MIHTLGSTQIYKNQEENLTTKLILWLKSDSHLLKKVVLFAQMKAV